MKLPKLHSVSFSFVLSSNGAYACTVAVWVIEEIPSEENLLDAQIG